MPLEWRSSLGTAGEGPAADFCSAGDSPAECTETAWPNPQLVFHRELDDHYLHCLLRHEEEGVLSPRLVLSGYQGYHIVFCRGRCYALNQELCTRPQEMREEELKHYQARGSCFVAPSLAEVKEVVDHHVKPKLRAGRWAIAS